MDRISEILEYISPEFKEKVLENKKTIDKQFFENKEEVKNQFVIKLNKIVKAKNNLEKIYIIISPLKSSLITKKYEVILAGYNEELYLDNEAVYEYFSIKCLFENIEKDIDYIKKEINKKFTRLLEFELREVIIKYEAQYMEMYLEYITKLLNEVDSLESERKIIILYGEYMEKSTIIKEIN
ncbi:hypothetical protein [[Clostridium] colinum]|uniref:hypothetical protein n=1 Tax=[Clostridium] colinum TaxID=36835 RepID=UPI002025208F|nr:hypothetical protein [[Clostridium] colinum]